MPNWAIRFLAFLLLAVMCICSWAVMGALVPPLPTVDERVIVNTEYLRGMKEARLRERTAALEAQYNLSVKLQGGIFLALLGIAAPVWWAMLKLRDDRRKVDHAISTFGKLETAVRTARRECAY